MEINNFPTSVQISLYAFKLRRFFEFEENWIALKKNKFKELLLKIVTRNILYHQYFMKYIQFFLRPIVGSIFSPEIPVERNFKKREKIFRQRKICDHQWRVPFVIATPVSIDFRIYANILIEAYEKLVSVTRLSIVSFPLVIFEIAARVDARRNSFRQLFHFYRQENSCSLRFIRSNNRGADSISPRSWCIFRK